MSKRIMMIAGILIIGLTTFSFLNIPFIFDTHIVNTEDQNSLVNLEESTLKKINQKIQEKYVGVGVKTTTKKELVLQVIGDEEYFNTVKKEIESIVESVIKTSILKNYKIVFERWDLIGDADEILNKDHHLILRTLMNGLNDYQVIDHISIDSQTTITIHTSIKGSDENAQKLVFDIEMNANKTLLSKELNSVANIDNYKIKIVDTEGIIINS